MAIFSPTIYYFGQPVQAAAVPGGGPTIRTDTYASSVTVAIPGTQFGSTFGQASYRSDISGYINGGSSLSDQTTTGTPVSNSTSNFTGYTTSMERPSGATVGNITGTTSNINFGSGAFTVEVWFKPNGSNSGTSWSMFSYNNGCGFFGRSGEGYYRWYGQNSTAGEAGKDYVTAAPSIGDWHHIFLSRSGNTWYGGVDGTIRINVTLSGAVGTTATFEMMGRSGDTMFNTLFQDFRVTKGVARYTGAEGASYTLPESIVIA
jgi:hypothetical protein